MRIRFLVLSALLAVGGCSDGYSPTDASSGTSNLQIAPPSGALEQEIYDVFLLFPNGISNAGLNRWAAVKHHATNGDQQAALFRLTQWVKMMAPRMSQPPNDETRSAAAARLALYMALYIYEGAGTPVPSYSVGADNAFGLVTPGQGGTIVTPSKNAGVSIPAGAVDENTIVVITENVTPYPANCSGPLNTTLCQYPSFYHFSQFPHEKLNSPAKFGVCHVNHGDNRALLNDIDHDRLRLAHDKPANSGDYTPGSTIRDGIEILPYVTQTFSLCEEVEYALNEPTGLDAMLARATTAIASFLTPKSAYAIDQGGGGMAVFFSNFNNVDSLSAPDDSVTVLGAVMAPSGDLSVSYKVYNVGTATSPGVLATITLTPFATAAAPPPISWTATGVMSLVPQDSINLTTTAPLPTGLPIGTYTVTVTLSSATSFPDANLANNSATTSVFTGGTILAKRKQ
jgi:hypothetical protein